jgi:hypothetical protein
MTDAEVLDFLRTRFAKIDERLDDITFRFDEMTHRLSLLEMGQAGIRRDLAGSAEADAAMRATLDRSASLWDRLSRRLDSIEALR